MKNYKRGIVMDEFLKTNAKAVIIATLLGGAALGSGYGLYGAVQDSNFADASYQTSVMDVQEAIDRGFAVESSEGGSATDGDSIEVTKPVIDGEVATVFTAVEGGSGSGSTLTLDYSKFKAQFAASNSISAVDSSDEATTGKDAVKITLGTFNDTAQ